jgi:hypothetical protein
MSAQLNIRPWELDLLTTDQFVKACRQMQQMRDELAKQKQAAKR